MGKICTVEPLPNNFLSFLVAVPSSSWSSTKTDGYFTNTISLGGTINTTHQPTVTLSGATVDTVPSAAQLTAYNLVSFFSFTNGTAVSQMVVKAKTKPTETFYVIVKGGDESYGVVVPSIESIDVSITTSNSSTLSGKRSGNTISINLEGAGTVPSGAWTAIGQLDNECDYPFKPVGVLVPNTSINAWCYIQITTAGLIRAYQTSGSNMVTGSGTLTYIV